MVMDPTVSLVDPSDRHELLRSKLTYKLILHQVLLIAQLLAFDTDGGFQSWVDSRPPKELCELYMTGMIDDTMLPGGRATDPCQGVDDASRYIPK